MSWLLVVLNRRRGAPFLLRDHPLVGYCAILLIGWSAASVLWATDFQIAVSNTIRLLQGVVLLLIVFTAVDERRHLERVVWGFMAGAALTAAIGLTGVGSGRTDTAYAGERLTGLIGDPNELAAILVPALAFASFALGAHRSPLLRWLLVAFIVVFALALFMTQSRGGLVAFGTTFAVAPFLAGPARLRTVAVLLTVVAAAVTYYGFLASDEARERVTTFSQGGGTGRPDLWTISVEAWRDHPLHGVGLGNFVVVEARYAASGDLDLARVDLVVDDPKVVHNTYLHVLAELGVVGFAAFAVVVFGSLGLGWRAVRRFARAGLTELEMLARGLLIGTVGMLAAYAFISAQYEKQLWLLLGLTAALGSLARPRERAEATA